MPRRTAPAVLPSNTRPFSGSRTHFSDDYLWLPFATCRYVACVADTGVLDDHGEHALEMQVGQVS